MKVLLKTIMAGPGGVFQPGVHSFPRALAKELIRTGQAEAVGGDEEETDSQAEAKTEERVEEAVDQRAEKRETATAPAQRRRPRKKVK